MLEEIFKRVLWAFDTEYGFLDCRHAQMHVRNAACGLTKQLEKKNSFCNMVYYRRGISSLDVRGPRQSRMGAF